MRLRVRQGFLTIFAAGALMIFAVPAYAIDAGQVDDFQDGTLQNWANGGRVGSIAPLNISTGGPAGANDNFLQIGANGSGPGQFLTVYNRDQWLGDYISAGITAIEVHLRNQGSVDLNIRLVFKNGIGPGAGGYVSTNPFFMAAGNSSWQHAVFLINPSSLTALNTPDDFNTFFSGNVAEFRFINSATDETLNGDPVTSQLGIDNIRAVPEPGMFALTSLGLLGLAGLHHRRR